MKVRYLGQTTDLRTNTPVVYAQMAIPDYLEIIGSKFDEFTIQRRREKHRAYGRMREDIVNGAQLPSITLALKPEIVQQALATLATNDTAALEAFLNQPDQVNILDGLQRTYLLHDLKESGTEFKVGQKLLVEFWFEKSIKNLIYRIIVLNAGQKPMSMRHQVELLFETIKTNLTQVIPEIKILVERGGASREGPLEYHLDRLVMAYQSYLTKSPEVSRESVIAQQLVEADVLDLNEDQIGEIYEKFIDYLKAYTELDEKVCRIYDGTDPVLPTGIEWFASEAVLNSYFSALSYFGTNEERKLRISSAIQKLKTLLGDSHPGSDPLGLGKMQAIIRDINPRKTNVGFATRKLINSVFKEYFREGGEKTIATLWASEAN